MIKKIISEVLICAIAVAFVVIVAAWPIGEKLDDPVIAKALLTQWVTLQVIVTPIFIVGRLFIAHFRAKRANS